MIELDGQLHEAHGGRPTPVALQAFEDGELHLEGAGRSLRLGARALRLGAAARDRSRSLQLADGAVVAIAGSDELEGWIGRHCGGARGVVSARARRVERAAGSLALTVAIGVALVRLGIPVLASIVARALPHSVEAQLGAAAERAMAGSLQPSALAPAERQRVRVLFERVASYAHVTHPARIELCSGGELGANAFALPGGAVLVTDELVALAQSEGELAGVLAHELGHLHHRHGLRALLQAAGIGVLASGALGDFEGSGLIAAAPALLQLQYSRAFEREADAFAARTLRDARIEPSALARMLERLEAAGGRGALPAYLSSHPPTEERQRALRKTN